MCERRAISVRASKAGWSVTPWYELRRHLATGGKLDIQFPGRVLPDGQKTFYYDELAKLPRAKGRWLTLQAEKFGRRTQVKLEINGRKGFPLKFELAREEKPLFLVQTEAGEYLLTCGGPGHCVWCLAEELSSGAPERALRLASS